MFKDTQHETIEYETTVQMTDHKVGRKAFTFRSIMLFSIQGFGLDK